MAVVAALALMSCGTSAVPSTNPAAPATAATALAPTQAPSSQSKVLFAVRSPDCYQTCTVSIVGLDGKVKATATFTPQSGFSVYCGTALQASPTQLASGSVFYLDATGAIHRLKADGTNKVVNKIPILTSDQITWFAVSRDGRNLMASVLAVPLRTSCKSTPGEVQMQVVAGGVDGTTTVIRDQRSQVTSGVNFPPRDLLAIVGWDDAGPVGVINPRRREIASLGGTTWWGPAAHLDGQARAGLTIGGTDCNPAFGDLPTGQLICYDAKQPTVRDTAGAILWTLKALDPGDESSYGPMALSPDSSRVAFVLNKACCYEFDSSVIRSRDGVRIGLGSTFYPQGWVDNETLVGPIGSGAQTCPSCPPFQPDAGLALLRVATPTKIEPLNIKGIFLGLL